MKKAIIAGVVLLLSAGFMWSGLGHYLTLEGMKDAMGQLQAQHSAAPMAFKGAFFAVYVGVTALSVPGVTLLTLAAGALFGLTAGTVLVSFASSLGATMAFLASRYVLRDAVLRRFGDRLNAINEGMAEDGALYLFTLRLIPIIPSFLVNILMGLTQVRALTFYAISQLGMLAATLVYVNAGTELARITSVSGIVSPGVLLSFALLGSVPLAGHWLTKVMRRRRGYRCGQGPHSGRDHLG